MGRSGPLPLKCRILEKMTHFVVGHKTSLAYKHFLLNFINGNCGLYPSYCSAFHEVAENVYCESKSKCVLHPYVLSYSGLCISDLIHLTTTSLGLIIWKLNVWIRSRNY